MNMTTTTTQETKAKWQNHFGNWLLVIPENVKAMPGDRVEVYKKNGTHKSMFLGDFMAVQYGNKLYSPLTELYCSCGYRNLGNHSCN